MNAELFCTWTYSAQISSKLKLAFGMVSNGWHKENRLIEGQIVPSVWFNLYSPQTDPASN